MNRANSEQLNFASSAAPHRPQARHALSQIPNATLLHVCDLDAARAADLAKLVPAARRRSISKLFSRFARECRHRCYTQASLAPLTLAAVRRANTCSSKNPARSTPRNSARFATPRKIPRASASAIITATSPLLKARVLVDGGVMGPLMFLRARYGHGGRKGYDREWRAAPSNPAAAS